MSWKYNSSSAPADYFLVTYCTEDECTTQSVQGHHRMLSLTRLKKGHLYFVTIQAVKLWRGRAYVSATENTSIVSPKLETSEQISLRSTEIANSSAVSVHANHLPPCSPEHSNFSIRFPCQHFNSHLNISILTSRFNSTSTILTARRMLHRWWNITLPSAAKRSHCGTTGRLRKPTKRASL